MAITEANLAETLGILGSQLTLGGLDLGVISAFTFVPTSTPYDFKSARTGKLVTVKSIVQEVSLAGTFTTSNILDDGITSLFTGGAGGEMIFDATEGALVAVRKNAETGGMRQTINITNASVRGTGLDGEAGTAEAKYNFAYTGLIVGDSASFGTILNALGPAV